MMNWLSQWFLTTTKVQDSVEWVRGFHLICWNPSSLAPEGQDYAVKSELVVKRKREILAFCASKKSISDKKGEAFR